MEKTKKRFISSVVLVAIVAAVVLFALVFGQTGNNNAVLEDNVAVTGTQADGMTSGIYNPMSKEEAIAHYNDLVQNQGYIGIEGQDKFDDIFYLEATVGAEKYALKPYADDGTPYVYTGLTAKYLNNTTIDGCGATLQITTMVSTKPATGADYITQQQLNLPNGDKGYGSGTLFELNIRKDNWLGTDSEVFIKASGGLARYGLGVHISNLNVEYTASMTATDIDSKIKDDAASYCYGGLFGILSVGDVNNVSGTPSVIENCRIYNKGYVNIWKGVNGTAATADINCRPYHALASFGTVAAYCYNSQFINSTVELGSDMNLIGYSAGAQNGAYKNGTPRVAIGGAFGILQNDCVVSDIYITGSGRIECTVSGTYYQVTSSAKLGMGGGLVGCVVDGSSSQEEFMMNGSGTTYIKNIVSNWQGTVYANGEVASGQDSALYSYDYTKNGLTGVIVGINGSYYTGSSGATDMSGIYFLYDGDTAPTYYSNFWAAVSGGGFSYADYNYAYISISEDGNNWLSLSDSQRYTTIEFDESGNNLLITYDLSSRAAERYIVWQYSTNSIPISELKIYNTWQTKIVKGEDGQDTTQAVTSYADAVKTQTVSFTNATATEKSKVFNTQVSFTSGQAAYYKVTGSDVWTSEDKKVGNAGIRTYQVENREYNAQVINAPQIEFYLVESMDGSPVATSFDNTQWGAQVDGEGAFTDVGSDSTKNVRNWYLSLRTDTQPDVNYAYYANVNGKNYVAYKAENSPTSSASGIEGTKISMRYYVYIINQKAITPVVTTTEADPVYDAAAKEYNVDFGSYVFAGDVVNATLEVFSVNGDIEKSEADGAINAGNYRVKITGLDNSNYKLSDEVVACDFEITKRELVSEISGKTEFVYNKNPQSPSIAISNQIEGIAQSDVISISYHLEDGSISENINANTYEIKVALSPEGANNYTLSGTTTGSMTIAPAPLEYKGLESYDFIYDSKSIGVQRLNEKGISFVNTELGYSCDFTVQFKQGEQTASSVIYVVEGGYECIITANNSTNYQPTTKTITVNVLPAPVTFGIRPYYDGEFNEENKVVYTGADMSFTASTAGIGSQDEGYYRFAVKAYPAVYDAESGKWVKEEGAEGTSTVHDAGTYIAIIEQTGGGNLDEDTNYDTISNPGTREFVFTIEKASLVWKFTGADGLQYDEASGKYSAVYNGQTFTLQFEGENVNIDDMLAPGDMYKYALTGNIEYFRETPEGTYSVGTSGVRDAGKYLVVPEVECGNNPELFVNYDIKGGVLEIQQREVTIVIKNISVEYGTHFEEITGEDFSNMWSYAPGSEQFLPEDGQMLTFYLRDIPMEETPVRGTYPYTFIPSPVNPNVNNYKIVMTNEHGDNSYCTITGLELKVEVVVTDASGAEVAVYPVESGNELSISRIYYGGAYNVSLRAVNANPEYVDVTWKDGSDAFSFTNNSDSKTVTFELSDETNAIYYIGEDKSAVPGPDGVFNLNFTVNKRIVEVTPNDVNVEYGKAFTAAGATFGGDGFVEGEQDWFKYDYSADGLGANVGETAAISVAVTAKDDHVGAEGNYNFDLKEGVATRVARVLHITFGDRDKNYGDPVLTIDESNYTLAEGERVEEGDQLGLKYVLTKDGQTYEDAVNLAAGAYAISATTSNANYLLEVADGSEFNVYPKAVNVTLEAVSVPYDTNPHPINVSSIEGLIEGDEGVTAVVQYLKDGSAIDGEPVNRGVYTANVTGFSSPNYSVGVVSGTKTVEITNVVVNVTVNDAVMAYGTGNIVPEDGTTFFTSDSTMFDGEDLQPYYIYNNGTGDVTKLAIDEYPGTLTLGFRGEAAANYDVRFTNAADLSVTAANLAEVAYLEEESSVYDGNGKRVVVKGVQTAQVEVVITKDGVVVDNNTGVVDAGEYVVTVTPLGSNYTGQAQLTYTVNKAAFDGSLSATSSTYNGNAVDLASLVSSKYGEVVFAITKDGVSVNEIKNAGSYTVTITAGENSNYQGSGEGITYVVNKKQIDTPTSIHDFEITEAWNGFTVKDAAGRYQVLITLDEENWAGATDSVTGLQPETDYTVYIKFAGDENHIESGMFSTTITTGEKLAAVLDPKDVTCTVYYNKVVVTVNGDGEYVYNANGGTWSGNTLNGLKANTDYTITVKMKESATHGESNIVTINVKTGADPASFNDLFNAFGDSISAADVDNYDKMMDAYEKLADGDKANVDKTKMNKLKSSYDALIAQINTDVIAAQNVARKAAGKGAAAAAAGVLATIVAAIVAKKKIVF